MNHKMNRFNNKFKKLLVPAIAGLLAAGLLTGCSGKTEETTEPEVVKTTAYLASCEYTADVYSLEKDEEGNEYFELYKSPVRGTEVLSLDETATAEIREYVTSGTDSAQSATSDSVSNSSGVSENTNAEAYDKYVIKDTDNSLGSDLDSNSTASKSDSVQNVISSSYSSITNNESTNSTEAQTFNNDNNTQASDETSESEDNLVTLSVIQFPNELTDSEGNDIYYYVCSDSLAFNKENIVKETSKYVRTSTTVYKNPKGPEIAGFSKKGSVLTVTGYDYLNEDGSVNKYEILDSEGTTKGWVYSKYLVDDEASANAVNEEIYEIHKDRIYTGLELNGGDPKNLDWYAYEKPAIEGNEFLSEAKTMYINASACVNSENYLKLIKSSGANAVVIDIKDGQLAYKSEVAKTLCPSAYETAFVTMDEYKAAVQKFKDAGVYVIGRIVCFSDSYYAADHPETCIESPEAYTAWPSAYSRDAWYYNVALAVEAVENMGFNEIQFDYVRFPENAYNMSQDASTDFKNVYGEDKSEAVQNFCIYAMDSIREAGAYFSVDVFGECADEYVTAYGQYWPAISQVVDAISGMPYTDHYGSAVDTWTNPYDIVRSFADKAAARQTEIANPAAARTWVTGYNTPNWNPTVDYDESKLEEQIRALYDAGLTGGFIPWNGGSNIDKYYEYAGIWSKDYKDDPQ